MIGGGEGPVRDDPDQIGRAGMGELPQPGVTAADRGRRKRGQQSDPRPHPIAGRQIPDQVGGPLGGLGRVPSVLPPHGGRHSLAADVAQQVTTASGGVAQR